jgi:hypothetical protein
MTCNDIGMFNCIDIKEVIKVGDGNYIKAIKMGSKRVSVLQPNNVIKHIVINDVKYVPKLWVNWFSITSTLLHRWNLSNEGIIISINKQGESLIFDQVLQTTSGAIAGVIMRPDTISNVNVGADPIVQVVPTVPAPIQEDVPIVDNVNVEEDVPDQGAVPNIPDQTPTVAAIPVICRDINAMHNLMGHAHFDAIKRSAKYYGMKLNGDPKRFVSCALAKIRQKNSNKVTLAKSQKPGDCLYVDISGSIWRSYGGAKYWVLIVDDYSRYCWSYFIPEKFGLKFIMLIFFKLLV